MSKYIRILIILGVVLVPSVSFAYFDAGGTPAIDSANAVSLRSNEIELEGATADAFETSIVPTDATADRTITLPDATGTVLLSTASPTAANSFQGVNNGIEFEGATADGFETTISITDATADRTITIPDGGGTIMLSSLATNATDAANSVTGASNALVFEGATADGFETSVSPTDPTADRTLTLPNVTGTIPASQASHLFTKMWVATDAVANGATSKAVTVTGVTTSSRCQATAFENSTNSVSIRSAIPTTDTVTVHVSGDPGASNLDISVLCVE